MLASEEMFPACQRELRSDLTCIVGSGHGRQIDWHPAQSATWTLTRMISSCSLRILGMGRKAQKNDSLPGSLDMLLLRTLLRRDLHGYGIVQFIQQSSENELLVEEGSLYPALQRLELNGWIDGIWGVIQESGVPLPEPLCGSTLPQGEGGDSEQMAGASG